MGKNFALYGVGKGVGIGAFGELRSGEGGGTLTTFSEDACFLGLHGGG